MSILIKSSFVKTVTDRKGVSFHFSCFDKSSFNKNSRLICKMVESVQENPSVVKKIL